MVFSDMGKYYSNQQNFLGIEDSPFAYWASPTLLSAFESGTAIESIAPPKQGSTTGNNDMFLRLWFEVENKNGRWYPCLKGGAFRKWYGNHSYYIDWENNGERIKSFGHQTIRNADKLFVEGISWSRVTISASSFRVMPKGFFFESASGVCFPSHNDLNYVLGLFNTKITQDVAEMINPTATLQSGDLVRIPVLIDEFQRRALSNLSIQIFQFQNMTGILLKHRGISKGTLWFNLCTVMTIRKVRNRHQSITLLWNGKAIVMIISPNSNRTKKS